MNNLTDRMVERRAQWWNRREYRVFRTSIERRVDCWKTALNNERK